QREEFPRKNARRDDVVACAFRRGLDQDRSFDFSKSLLGHVSTDFVENSMTQVQVCLQLRTAEIEIAILPTQVFAGDRTGPGVELKRRSARIVEYQDFSCVNFDVAGSELGVAGVLSTLDDYACNSDHVLAAQLFRFCVRLRREFSVKDDLSDTGPIAKIDKREFAKVATSRDPSHQHHLLADVTRTQISAGVRTFQISEVI